MTVIQSFWMGVYRHGPSWLGDLCLLILPKGLQICQTVTVSPVYSPLQVYPQISGLGSGWASPKLWSASALVLYQNWLMFGTVHSFLHLDWSPSSSCRHTAPKPPPPSLWVWCSFAAKHTFWNSDPGLIRPSHTVTHSFVRLDVGLIKT